MATADSKPLTEREIAELDELLAALPEDNESLDVAMLDGFLAGVLLAPDDVPQSAWLPFVFDGQGRAVPDTAAARRAVELVLRRYHELAAYLAAREPFDPIVFELEDEEGRSLTGKEAIAALTPWSAGLAHAFDIVPALSAAYDADADLAAALTGVLRHLPLDPDDASPEAADFLLERDRIEHDVPLRDLDDAIDELVAAVLDAVEITRPHRPLLRDAPKVGRNDPCPCGSGRKYKACHGRESGQLSEDRARTDWTPGGDRVTSDAGRAANAPRPRATGRRRPRGQSSARNTTLNGRGMSVVRL